MVLGASTPAPLFLYVFWYNRNFCLLNCNIERLNILKGKVNRSISEIIVLSVPPCTMKWCSNFIRRSESIKDNQK